MYALAVLLAGGIGAAAAFPKAFVALFILVIIATVAVASLRNPWTALLVTVVQYPVITTLRTLYTAFHLPVFFSGARFLPELLQCLILAYLLIRGSRDARFRLRIYGDDLPVVAYIITGIYSFVVAWQHIHPLGPINGWYVSMTPAVFYLLIRWLQPTSEQTHRLIRQMGIAYIILAVVSLAAYFRRPDWFMWMSHAEHPFFVPDGLDPLVFWRFNPRMQSFLFEENVWGTVSELVAVLSAAFLMRPGSPRRLYGLFLLGTLCLALSISRGAIVSFVIAILALLIQRGRHQKRILGLLAVLAALGGCVLITLKDTPIVFTIVGRLNTVNTKKRKEGEIDNDRVLQWKRGLEVFEQMPSGKGLGTVGYGAALSKVSQYMVGDGLYFRILAEQGVPGILVFLYMIGSITWILWRYRQICSDEWKPLGNGLLAFHIGFCVHGLGANTFDYYCLSPVYFMLVALFVSAVHRDRALALAKEKALAAPRYVPLIPGVESVR